MLNIKNFINTPEDKQSTAFKQRETCKLGKEVTWQLISQEKLLLMNAERHWLDLMLAGRTFGSFMEIVNQYEFECTSDGGEIFYACIACKIIHPLKVDNDLKEKRIILSTWRGLFFYLYISQLRSFKIQSTSIPVNNLSHSVNFCKKKTF